MKISANPQDFIRRLQVTIHRNLLSNKYKCTTFDQEHFMFDYGDRKTIQFIARMRGLGKKTLENCVNLLKIFLA